MSPRGNNPQKQCYANAKQKPQKNTHAGELSIEITLLNHTSHWSFPINSLYTHRKPPRRIFLESRFCTDIQLVKILKLDFVKRNLLKVKTHETIVLIGCNRWKLSCTLFDKISLWHKKELTCNKFVNINKFKSMIHWNQKLITSWDVTEV